jgi:hypothetical protein
MLLLGRPAGNVKVSKTNILLFVSMFLITCLIPALQNMLDQVKEIYHFSQDDLMTEDIFVLDCHSDVFVWVGQEVDPKVKSQTIDIGEVIIECSLCVLEVKILHLILYLRSRCNFTRNFLCLISL